MVLSRRVLEIEPSPTMGLLSAAKNLKAQGHDVIEFGAGEPDFNTPEHIKKAGIAAIENNMTHYTANLGIKELRDAISAKLKDENDLHYPPEQIIVSSGAKHSLFNTIMALCEVGDEVIIPSPYWVTYPELVKIAGGIPVIVSTSGDSAYKMTPAQLEAAITKRTKLVIINSPSNPTGAVYTEDELRKIAKICVDKDLYVIADEIYEKLIYDGEKHVSIASFNEEIKKRTVTLNGVSKAYAMTGWRIGYAVAEKTIIQAMDAFQSHATSAPATISQKASEAAIAGSQAAVEAMCKEFDQRRTYMVERLNAIEGITCLTPKGAFYAFPDVTGLYGSVIGGEKIENDSDFARVLLEKVYVAAVPGTAFGSPGNLRVSYAASMAQIKEGLDRIKTLVEGHQG